MSPVKFPRRGGQVKIRGLAIRLFSAVMVIGIGLPALSWSAGHQEPLLKPALRLQIACDEGGPTRPFLSQKKPGARRRNFENLSPAERDRIKKQYQEWQSLPPEEKEILRHRWDQWNKLSPRQQEVYRHRYRQWQQMPPEERRRLQQDLNRWDSLSPQERDAIRRRFSN